MENAIVCTGDSKMSSLFFFNGMTKLFTLVLSTCWSCFVTEWNIGPGSATVKCCISEPAGWYLCPFGCIAQEGFCSTAP